MKRPQDTTRHHRNRTLQNTVPPQTARVKAADSSEPSDSSDANLRQDVGHHDVLGIILDQLVLHETVMAEFLTTKIQFYPVIILTVWSYSNHETKHDY